MTDAATTKAVPFEDLATKDDMWAHLHDHHGNMADSRLIRQTYGGKSKVTKDTLIKYHNTLHQNNEVAVVAHTHVAITGDAKDEAQARLEALRNGEVYIGEKPLTSAERTALKTLVDNDFASLKSEMQQFAADTRIARTEEVRADWAAKRAEGVEYVDKMKSLIERFIEEAEALNEGAKAIGIKLDTSNIVYVAQQHRHRISYDAVGERDAVLQVEKEVKQDLDRALLTLERQRLTVHRSVLLASIPQGAQALVQELPKAGKLMLEAAQTREAQKSIETAGEADFSRSSE